MRGSQAAAGGERRNHKRFGFPYVERHQQVGTLPEHGIQRLIVDHRTATAVDQPGPRSQPLQTPAIKQVPGRMRTLAGKRNVATDDITVRYQLIQLDQPLSTLLGQGWITQQGLDPERLQHRGQPAADLAYADDANRPVLPGRGRLLGEGQQAAQHVFHHAPGVAAGRTGHLDPRRRKTGQIQMIGAYGAGPTKRTGVPASIPALTRVTERTSSTSASPRAVWSINRPGRRVRRPNSPKNSSSSGMFSSATMCMAIPLAVLGSLLRALAILSTCAGPQLRADPE